MDRNTCAAELLQDVLQRLDLLLPVGGALHRSVARQGLRLTPSAAFTLLFFFFFFFAPISVLLNSSFLLGLSPAWLALIGLWGSVLQGLETPYSISSLPTLCSPGREEERWLPMMVERKNRQQGKSPKKAIQAAACPVFPAHSNASHMPL